MCPSGRELDSDVLARQSVGNHWDRLPGHPGIDLSGGGILSPAIWLARRCVCAGRCVDSCWDCHAVFAG